MPGVLHLLKGDVNPLAAAAIARQVAAGDRVTLVLLEGAATPAGVGDVTVHRVPDDVDYGRLLDLIFESDQVIAW